MDFLVGQLVRWSSQSRGYQTTKEGIICCAVPAGEKPSKEYKNLHTGAGCGSSRKEISYVVCVDGKFYWPRVGSLCAVVHDPNRSIPAENFVQTVAANVHNPSLTDKGFREFVKSTLPIVRY